MHEPAGAVGPAGIDNGPRQISACHDRSTVLDHTHSMATRTRLAQHHRTLTEDHRRPSLVKLRSRSNTSTGSHDVSVIKRGFSTDALPDFGKGRTSPDRPKSMLQKLDKQEGFRKGLKAKSSRLFKRPENRDDLTSLGPLDWSDEFNDICPKVVEGPHSPSVSRQSRRPSKDATHRYNISEPFDFQHLTHTDPSQFQKMQEASQYDIVSEFSALRASQAPRRQLQGIKAQNLTWPEDAPDSPTSSLPAGHSDSSRSDAPVRDHLQHSLYVPPSPTSTTDLSDEDIYLNCTPASDSAHLATISSPEPDRFGDAFPLLSSRTSHGLPHQPSMDYPIATWADGVYNFTLPHAMTTPDDVAHTLHPPPFHINRTELSQVLEEDEYVDGKRCSFAKSTNLSLTPSSDFWYNKSLSGSKHSPQKGAAAPAAQTLDEKRNQTARPPSVFEQPAHDIPFRPHSCGPSDVAQDMEASWEDDIDWCYKHAAEADCNFDWNRSSTVHGELNIPLASFSERATHQLEQRFERKLPLRFTHATQRSSSLYASVPSITVPIQSDVPDLEPPSAISAQSSFDNVSEAVTPIQTSATDLNQHFLTAACKPACQDWVDHASPMPTQNDPESTMIYEDHFHVIYARKSLPEQGFPIGQVDGSTISSASPRSSRSPLSKSSSQESFWSRRDHRSNSGSSVPDLIQSRFSGDRRACSGEQIVSTDSIATASGDMTQSTTHHRRSQSLARDVAQKTILTKVKNRDSGPLDGGSLPPPTLHGQGRHSPDASMRSVDMWSAPFPARPFPSRSRASSQAGSSGQKPPVHLPYLTVNEAQA